MIAHLTWWHCAGLVVAIAAASSASAAERSVPAGGDLQLAIAVADEGDVLVLRAGIHAGPVRLDKRITLQGMPGAVVEGNGTGSVVTIQAAGAVVSGLEVRGSENSQKPEATVRG
jgi:nitrous oxidase accessory protein